MHTNFFANKILLLSDLIIVIFRSAHPKRQVYLILHMTCVIVCQIVVPLLFICCIIMYFFEMRKNEFFFLSNSDRLSVVPKLRTAVTFDYIFRTISAVKWDENLWKSFLLTCTLTCNLMSEIVNQAMRFRTSRSCSYPLSTNEDDLRNNFVIMFSLKFRYVEL